MKSFEMTKAILQQLECQIAIVFYKFWSYQINMMHTWM